MRYNPQDVPRILDARVVPQIDLLVLHSAPETFREDVVVVPQYQFLHKR